MIPRDPVDEIDPTYVIDYEGCDIPKHQIIKLKQLTGRYPEVFSKNGYDLGYARVAPISMKTTTEIPYKPVIYATHRGQRGEVTKHVEWMKKAGCIKESDTHWLSPIVMVKKKNGEMRPCIDLRKLNEITVSDHYPLPKVQDALDIVGGRSYYSKIDLSKGFWQLPLDEEASKKCGMITENKVYQCLTMPFGWKNAPSAFMRAMSVIFEGLEDVVYFYMDDIVVMTREDDLREGIWDIWSWRCSDSGRYNIKANPKKCELARREIEFLGHRMNKDGYRPDERNMVKICRVSSAQDKEGSSAVHRIVLVLQEVDTGVQSYSVTDVKADRERYQVRVDGGDSRSHSRSYGRS